MKTNSCYSLFIILLATSPLSGMKGPEKAIQKKSTKKNTKNPELTITKLTALFGSLPIERFSLSNLNDLVKKCGNPLILLHQAITQNNIDLVEALLQYKLVEPNKELNGFTALHKASKDQSIELLNILLPHTQASLSQKDRDELLPIDYAIKTMNLDMVKIFINYNSPISKFLIADAVFEADDDSQDNMEIINLLCQKYSSSIDLILDKEDYLQETALEAALHENKIKTVELLLKNGAQSNGPKNADTAPLFFAMRDSVESILLLRKYGANVSKKAGLKRKDFVENIILKKDMTPANFARKMYNQGLRDATWLTTVLHYLDPTRTYKTDSEKMETD